MTLLGVFFIPAVLACFLWRPLYLLPLLVLASIFEAGSVFNGAIGDFEFGISPFYLTEIVIALRLAMLLFGTAKLLPSKNSSVRGIAVVLCAFWLWSFSSAFVMPHLFAGTLISTPRAGTDADFVPLQWTLSNLAQAAYLTLNVAMILYAVHVVRTRQQTAQLMKALYWALFVVALIGFAQVLAAEAGWDFPYDTFNSNPTYGRGTEQEIGSIRRVNSTFTEPSNAGSYLAAASCGLLASFLSGRRGIRWLTAILVLITVLFLTTSTTGFGALALGVFALVLYFNPFRRHKQRGRSSGLSWLIILAVFGILALVLLLAPDLSEAVLAMTIEKSETYSFWGRIASDIHAFTIFTDTRGLGAGLGSTRSSGLLLTLLSTLGIVGSSLFAVLLYRIIKAFPGKSAGSVFHMVFWALLTQIISQMLAVPDLNRPTLWAFLMLVVAQLNVPGDPRMMKNPTKGPGVLTRLSLQEPRGVALAK